MSIKYEKQSIKNSQETVKERIFIRIFEHETITTKRLNTHIQASCSLTEMTEAYNRNWHTEERKGEQLASVFSKFVTYRTKYNG